MDTVDMDIALDIAGQQPGLQIHTQICSCYGMHDTSSATKDEIVSKLQTGLSRLGESFPWTAGQVVNTGAGEGNTGVFSIRPLSSAPQLVVKDLTSDSSVPTMTALREASFPMRLLDENIFCPLNTLPGNPKETMAERAAVFLAQVTFIQGGLVLAFNGQHQTMDMTGQGAVIGLLDKACRGEAFSAEDLATGNMPRQALIPLLDKSYVPGNELARQLIQPSKVSQDAATQPSSPPPCSWLDVQFSGAALDELKTLANKTLPPQPEGKPDTPSFVSTDDTLTAFLWQRLAHSRSYRLPAGEREAVLARAIDVRKVMGVSPRYTGLLQNMTYHAYPTGVHGLADAPLGAVASNLRAAITARDASGGSVLKYHTRATATYLSRSQDKSVISPVAGLDVAVDVALSSWAKIDSYALGFGLGLGYPEAVRRPHFVPVESLLYLLPRKTTTTVDGVVGGGDGEIMVVMCIRDEDIERLKADPELAKYGKILA